MDEKKRNICGRSFLGEMFLIQDFYIGYILNYKNTIGYPSMSSKRALEKSSALVYNLLRKVIGYDSDLPSVL